MLNNFIYAQTKDLFLNALNAGNVLDEAIVFIEDTKEIWNHGHYFGGGSGSGVDSSIISELQTAVSQLEADKLDTSTAESTYAKKSELPNLSGYLTQTTADTLYATITSFNGLQEEIDDLITTVSQKANSSDLDNYATSDRVTTLENYFSTAEDSDATINKWHEIVAFLEGVNEGSTVESLLAAKANQSALNDLQTSIAGLASESWVSNNFLGLGGGTIESTDTYGLVINAKTDASGLQLQSNGTLKGILIGGGTWGAAILNVNTFNGIGVLDDGTPYFKDSYSTGNTYTLLHSGNYSDYAVKYVGDSSVDNARHSIGYDDGGRGSANLPEGFSGGFISADNGYYGFQMFGAGSTHKLFFRPLFNGSFRDWSEIIHTGNIGSYAPIYSSSGNVLIGTTEDSGEKLQVIGAMSIMGRLSGVTYLTTYGTSYGVYQGNYFNDALSTSDIAIYSNKLYLHGNVGIGTTSPAYPLDVNGHIAGHEIYSFAGWMTLLGTENVSYATYLDNKNQYGLKIHYSNGVAGAFFSQDGNTYFYGNLTTSGEITAPTFNGNLNGSASKVNGYSVSVVSSMPSSPDANTIYYVTG